MQVEMHLALSHELFQEVDAVTRGGVANILPSPRTNSTSAHCRKVLITALMANPMPPPGSWWRS